MFAKLIVGQNETYCNK